MRIAFFFLKQPFENYLDSSTEKVLDLMAYKLIELAEKQDIPFQFNHVLG